MNPTINAQNVQLGQSPFILSFADFQKDRTEGDIVIFANRESSRSQKEKHNSKDVLMQGVHLGLKLQEPYIMRKTMLRFNGSGKLCDVNSKKGYFIRFAKTIKKGLGQIAPGKKLYILFVTQSRLIRPSGYDYQNQSATWTYRKGDYTIFNQWVQDTCGAQSEDVRFVILCPLPPADERYFESWLGKFCEQCLKSIGKRLSRKMSPTFKPIVIKMRQNGMSTPEIVRELEMNCQNIKLPAPETIRKWLREAGLSEKRGRRWHK